MVRLTAALGSAVPVRAAFDVMPSVAEAPVSLTRAAVTTGRPLAAGGGEAEPVIAPVPVPVIPPELSPPVLPLALVLPLVLVLPLALVVSSVKVRDALPVWPAAFVSLATTVCWPSTRPVGVKLQAPLASAVALVAARRCRRPSG